MSDSTYVRTMAALERINRAVDPTIAARAPALRDSVLRAADVTLPELEAAAEWLAAHPDEATELWRAIDAAARAERPAIQ